MSDPMTRLVLNQVCLRTISHPEPWSLKTYRDIGGYEVWLNILERSKVEPTENIAQEILESIKKSNLRGRGGAGFPTGLKWSFISHKGPGPKYVVCNSDEGEPGTAKDRDVLRYNPHQVIEGMLIASYVMGAKVAYNYIRGEFAEPFNRFKVALEEAYAAGLLGENVKDSGLQFDIYPHKGAGAYICGEETALLESLEGKKGFPRFKPPFPANIGLYGVPTVINNTETFASVPVILSKGWEWFLELGKPNSGGTKIFSVTGHVNKPGNYEVPLGIPFAELLALAGGVWKGKNLKAVIPGGSSMPVLPAEIMLNTDMDYDSIAKAGSMLGSGAVIVMDEDTCMVKMCARIAHFYKEESCGQCTPCREGTGWLWRVSQRIEEGKANSMDIDNLLRVAKNIEGRTICALGEAAAWPVAGFIRHFRAEFEEHVIQGKCPYVS